MQADVVCVVYAVDDEDSLDSVTEHWLPLLRLLLPSQNFFKIPSFQGDLRPGAHQASDLGWEQGGPGGLHHYGRSHAHYERLRGD